MERSPRSAGVRPRTAAIMGQYLTLRSFVIFLAIAVVINNSPVCGFTVAREMVDLTPDQEAGENTQLEVRYDLKSLNYNDDSIYEGKTSEDSDSTVIAINNSKLNNINQNYSYKNFNETQPFVTETTGATTIISTVTDSDYISNSALGEIQTATTESNTNQYPPTVTAEQTSFKPDIFSTPNNMKDKTSTVKPDINNTPNNMKDITSTVKPDINNTPNTMTDINTTAKLDTNNTLNIINSNDVDKSENNTNYFTNTTKDAEPESDYTSTISLQHKTIANFESTTKTDTLEQKADQTIIQEENTIAKTDGSLGALTTNMSTETTTIASTIDLLPTLPPWKKYTTIDRKNTSTKEIPTTENEMTQAESAQTSITIEKTFTNAPGTETNKSYEPGNETETKTEATKLEIVSKRAGFKDNRDMTTPKPEEIDREEIEPSVTMNSTETNGEFETEASDFEMTNNKKVNIYESQSQLAEDAIKEELLKEETLNDNEENSKYHRMKQASRITDLSTTFNDVKHISQENKKHTNLYAVSPNYKPPKKIDVQPPKQFVRDPDDNSWRNESISSLGIVFKPKNASKSFTQVLKNKTETELGNITDKDSKSDLPDLRDRLEKIAEVRKLKKKINKFGDTVYSDYEESGENANLFRSDMKTPMTFTPPSPSQLSTSDLDLKTNAISKEHFDMFKNERTPPITTIKPKKYNNLAEYYDASDEYDADYENKHKIDLKKFAKPKTIKENIATHPPELLYTQPMREYQPLRVATLQYFPPTKKIDQKVNINDYDNDFKRKVNLYNYDKATPKNVISNSFGTAPPISTENDEPYKVTTKAPFTSMYHPENFDKNLYLENYQRVSEPPNGGVVTNDGSFNRASYVIKHYRDFINEAAKQGEGDRSDYPFTESPVHGVTANELAKMTPPENSQAEEDYDYEAKFRKEVMNRFVDNFNQNSERFKVSFPILYNTSVVHRQPSSMPDHGRVASSSAFMKRLYEVGHSRPSQFLRKMCDPHCEKTVELSPAYELHYYVPDEEEKEEMQPRSMTAPDRLR